MSISTDPTEDIPLWHQRLTANALPGLQYLDENAVAATKAKVQLFREAFNQLGLYDQRLAEAGWASEEQRNEFDTIKRRGR